MGWVFRIARLAIAVCSLPALCTCSSEAKPEGLDAGLAGSSSTEPEGGPIGDQCHDEVEEPPPAFEVAGCSHSFDGGNYAVFGWANRSGVAQTAAYGAVNQVSPGPAAQGQSEYFEIGTSGRFIVAMTEPSVTWTVLDQAVTVSADTPDCAEICVYVQLAGPDSYEVDTCDEACGDGECDGGENCGSCASDCDCSALEPFVDCVRVEANGAKIASFGFRNAAARAGAIARGTENGFSPGELVRAQPTFFPPGETHDAFQVTYTETELTWTLGALSVTADATAPECAASCDACAEGISCVGELCRQSCGDGLCSEGDCASCPADCACPSARDVCLPSGSCFGSPRCGIEAYCGTLDSFGSHLDCGQCPDGQTCVVNVCQPICGADGG